MEIVVDASIAASWFLPDEQSDPVTQILLELETGSVHVPSLFWFEMLNLLLMAERRGHLAAGEAVSSMALLRKLPIQDEADRPDAAVLALAAIHGLSACDASYLELATQLALPLATNDARLAAAARSAGVQCVLPLP